MLNRFLFLALILQIIIGCSSDDGNESTTEGNVLTRTVAKTSAGAVVEEETFEYIGNKLYKKTSRLFPVILFTNIPAT